MHPFDPTPHIERTPDAADIGPLYSPIDLICCAACVLGAVAVIGLMVMELAL